MPLSEEELEMIACVLAERMDTRRQSSGPRLMDIPQAAAYLGRSLSEFQAMVKRGTIPVTKIDSKVQFDRAALRRWRLGIQGPLEMALSVVRRAQPTRFVYFIACGSAVKIGVTDHVPSRLKALQTACPTPLRLVASVPGGVETEQALHNVFADYRMSGEWFRFEGPLKQLAEGIRWRR